MRVKSLKNKLALASICDASNYITKIYISKIVHQVTIFRNVDDRAELVKSKNAFQITDSNKIALRVWIVCVAHIVIVRSLVAGRQTISAS